MSTASQPTAPLRVRTTGESAASATPLFIPSVFSAPTSSSPGAAQLQGSGSLLSGSPSTAAQPRNSLLRVSLDDEQRAGSPGAGASGGMFARMAGRDGLLTVTGSPRSPAGASARAASHNETFAATPSNLARFASSSPGGGVAVPQGSTFTDTGSSSSPRAAQSIATAIPTFDTTPEATSGGTAPVFLGAAGMGAGSAVDQLVGPFGTFSLGTHGGSPSGTAVSAFVQPVPLPGAMFAASDTVMPVPLPLPGNTSQIPVPLPLPSEHHIHMRQAQPAGEAARSPMPAYGGMPQDAQFMMGAVPPGGAQGPIVGQHLWPFPGLPPPPAMGLYDSPGFAPQQMRSQSSPSNGSDGAAPTPPAMDPAYFAYLQHMHAMNIALQLNVQGSPHAAAAMAAAMYGGADSPFTASGQFPLPPPGAFYPAPPGWQHAHLAPDQASGYAMDGASPLMAYAPMPHMGSRSERGSRYGLQHGHSGRRTTPPGSSSPGSSRPGGGSPQSPPYGVYTGAPSTLLEEFKANRQWPLELRDIVGHVDAFAKDHKGSRFIQEKLVTSSPEVVAAVFDEMLPSAGALMVDQFGNYVIQKFFEIGSAEQKAALVAQLNGQAASLSMQMYGCRVVQKCIESGDVTVQGLIVDELASCADACVHNSNGNHVVQKIIEFAPTHRARLLATLSSGMLTLAQHPYGCRVVQRCLEHCRRDELLQLGIVEVVLANVVALSRDQYGNYVVQHVVMHGTPEDIGVLADKVAGQVVSLSVHKYASNVIEKCLLHADADHRATLLAEIAGHEVTLAKDQYGNYVLQRLLQHGTPEDRQVLAQALQRHTGELARHRFACNVVQRLPQPQPQATAAESMTQSVAGV